jgi:hypothetical protein
MTDDLVKRLRLPWPKDGSGDEVTLPIWVLILTAEAADRIDELEVSLQAVLNREAATTARYGAKTDELEAKLAKAVRTMREAVTTWEQPHYGDMDTAVDHGSEAIDLIRATLAEIEGGKT